MPNTQSTNSGAAETAGIDQAIANVETLYRTVTGRNPPLSDGSPTSIPVEKNPGQFVEEQMDRLLALLEQHTAGSFKTAWCPLLSVAEDDAELVVEVDLPGVERRDVEVSIEGNVLTVRGRRTAGPGAGKRVRLAESPSGAFSRQVLLPATVRLGEPRAQLKDGVLEISIAKQSPAEPATKTVPVN